MTAIWGQAAAIVGRPGGISMVALTVCLALAPARGVEAQYNSPVGKEANTGIPSKDSLDKAYKDARWSAGALRIQPWIGLRDASFVTVQRPNPDGSVSETDDFTVTAGAGLRAYLRTSPKLVLAVQALPEYVWWEDDDNKSRLNGRYGAGLFGFFNRLQLEASVRRTERQDIFSTEVQQLTTLEENLSRLGAELELRRGLRLYLRARAKDYGNNDEDAAVFSRLNRSEDDVTAGVRLESRRGLSLGLGYRDQTADFDPGSRNLSNDGKAILFDLGYGTGKFDLSVDLEQVELEPSGSESILVPADELLGKVELVWEVAGRIEVMFYRHRDLTYSVSGASSHVVSGRTGVTGRLQGGRGQIDLTWAVGDDEYEPLAGGLNRADDVTELRASLRVPLGNLLSLTVYGTSLDYDSNLDDFDRDFSTYGLAVDFGRLAERLSLGESEGVW